VTITVGLDSMRFMAICLIKAVVLHSVFFMSLFSLPSAGL
jgi:hypothetical protein